MIPEKVPQISLPVYANEKIETRDISSFLKDYLIMVFYPYDFTTICPTEVNEFSKRYYEFIELRTNVIFVSTDSVYSHKVWARMRISEGGIEGVKWPMCSDYSKELSSSLSLLNNDGSCKRATVIVDKSMKIRHYSYNDNSIGRSVFEIIRLLNAIIFHDKNGELCPVNWRKPNDKEDLNSY